MIHIGILPQEITNTGGADCRDVLRSFGTRGPDAIRKAIAEAELPEVIAKRIPKSEGGEESDGPPPFVNLIDCSEFLALDLKPRFLIRDVLVSGQPMVIGGRSKTLKTTVATDLIVSLGSGTPFLGRFHSERVPTAFWSGESGAAVIRETAQRVAASKEVNLADCSIHWSFTLPKLSRADHLDALAEVIEEKKLEVVVVDPLYLALLTADAAGKSSDLFFMGSVLQPLSELGQKTGCTIILLHHFRKNGQADDSEPAGFEELSMSGCAEWCRQFILLQRRSPYKADGRHELWMRTGGSAGHAGLWSLDIEEGLLDPDTFSGRRWQVSVGAVADAREEAKRQREDRKAADMEKRESEHQDRLREVLGQFPDGETERRLRTAARLNPDNFGRALLSLEKDGRAEPCSIEKSGKKYDGWRAKP